MGGAGGETVSEDVKIAKIGEIFQVAEGAGDKQPPKMHFGPDNSR